MRCKFEFWMCLILSITQAIAGQPTAAAIFFAAAMYFSAHHKDQP